MDGKVWRKFYEMHQKKTLTLGGEGGMKIVMLNVDILERVTSRLFIEYNHFLFEKEDSEP